MLALRRSTVPAALLAPATFLAVDPAGWYPFGPARWMVATVLVLASLALALADRRVVLDRSTAVAWAVLLALVLVATAVGIDGLYAWIGTPERRLGLVAWSLLASSFVVGQHVVGEAAGRPSGEAWLRAGLVAAGLGVGGVAVAEALGAEVGPIGSGDRLGATFGNASFLGAATALLLPVVVAVAADRQRSSTMRMVAGASTGGVLVGLIGSGARAAWVGSAVAAAVALAARRTRRTRPGGSGAGRSRGRTVLGAGVAVAVGVLLVVVTPAGDRLGALADPDAPGGAGRVDEWRVAARVVAAHPLTGVGPEGYRIAFAEGVDRDYERAHGRDPLPDRAHSAPLDVALAGGVGAAAAWLVLMALVARASWRVLGSEVAWRRGVAVGWIAHGVGSLFLFPTFELGPVAWLLAGALVAWSRSHSSTGRATSVEVAVPRAVPAAVGALAVVAALVGGAGVVADRRAETAVRALERGDLDTGIEAVEASIRWRPDVLRYRLLAARLRVEAGEGQLAALEEVDAALDLSPRDPIAVRERASILVRRARATLVPEHASAARVAVDRLVERDRFLAEGHLLEGDLAAVEGDAERAIAAWHRAADLAPRSAAPWLRLADLHATSGDEAAEAVARARAAELDGTG